MLCGESAVSSVNSYPSATQAMSERKRDYKKAVVRNISFMFKAHMRWPVSGLPGRVRKSGGTQVRFQHGQLMRRT